MFSAAAAAAARARHAAAIARAAEAYKIRGYNGGSIFDLQSRYMPSSTPPPVEIDWWETIKFTAVFFSSIFAGPEDLAAAGILRSIPWAARATKGERAAQKLLRTCNSFTPGTKILLANGTYKPIEKVKVGDKVLATDPNTGKTKEKKVTASFGGTSYNHLIQITVDTDGKHGHKTGVVIATEHHLFWNQNTKHWKHADQLNQGDKLRTPEGATLNIIRAMPYPGHPTVYDLTIANTHTYYVLAGETPVLVHNSGPCDPPLKSLHPDSSLDKSSLDNPLAWNEHDYVAALFIRDFVESGIPQLSQKVKMAAGQQISRTDSEYLSFTRPGYRDLLARVADIDVSARGWWWDRIPISGPVLKELHRNYDIDFGY